MTISVSSSSTSENKKITTHPSFLHSVQQKCGTCFEYRTICVMGEFYAAFPLLSSLTQPILIYRKCVAHTRICVFPLLEIESNSCFLKIRFIVKSPQRNECFAQPICGVFCSYYVQLLRGCFRFASAAHAEFLQNVAHVTFHRRKLYTEYFAYFGVALVGAKKPQYLHLGIRKPLR